MNTATQRITVALLVTSMFALTSCEGIPELPIPPIPGLGGGGRVGFHNMTGYNRIPVRGGRGGDAVAAAVAALLVTAIVIHVAKSYRISQRQRELAEERAKDRLRSSYAQQKMAANHVRKAGVVVPAKDGKPAGIAVTDKNGNPTGEAYVPKPGESLKKGGGYELGNNKLYMADSWQGV